MMERAELAITVALMKLGESDILLQIYYLIKHHQRTHHFKNSSKEVQKLSQQQQQKMFDEDRHFDFFEYQHLTKDFCYSKPLSFHFSSNNDKNRCEFNQTVEFKSSKCWLTDLVKVESVFEPGKTLKINASNHFMKVHYRHILPKQIILEESQEIPQKPQERETFTVYGTAYADRKLQNSSLQLGLNIQTENSWMNANLTTFLYEGKNEYFIFTKFLHKASRYNIGFLSLFDMACKNLQTNDLVLEFKPHPKHRFFLRAEVDGLRNYSLNYSKISHYFDYITSNYIIKPSDTLTLMAEIKYDVNAKKLKHIESLIEKRLPDKKFKMKINNLADLTMQLQFPLQVGKDSNVNFGFLLADLFKSRRISYGFKVNLNY